ncbi:hypothetical protein HIM_07549 [Hirsutella minnesotensis 3608]|uniref:Phosphatidylinositol-specific phospholipase C X domain-containing protein n=1 Tax=Hirsutella minnesotensis 3608 TaxID=1043627 RepID=A0A0F7ZYS4_9HYPO|nr:hypothetical protein HIM_07549 [Hirsutella minnesotensis 3608]
MAASALVLLSLLALAPHRHAFTVLGSPTSPPHDLVSSPSSPSCRVEHNCYLGLQCQNWALADQLRAGLRYFDIRARLRDGELRVYHADGDTGFGLADVLLAMFAFLDENPSEALVMRLKQEGPPIRVPGAANDTAAAAASFEDVFNRYRLVDKVTSPGAARHLHMYDPRRDGPIPTLGQLRSKILLLQNFPSAGHADARYGIAWEGPQMVLEDAWVVPDLYHLADKWVAIRNGLSAAAQAPLSDPRLYIAHISASVGVLPIDAAAGPANRSITGMNDMTAQWLLDYRGHKDLVPRVGVVIFDFPGHRAIEAVLAWNKIQPTLPTRRLGPAPVARRLAA